MEIKELSYTIEGLTPLLMHNPRSMMLGQQSNGGPKKQVAIPSAEEEAEAGAYRTSEGFLAVPAIGVRNCTIVAAGAFKYKTRSWRSFVSHIQIEPGDLLVLRNGGDEFISDYEIDIRRTVNRTTKGAVPRARPLVKKWKTSFSFIVDTSMLPTDDPHALIKTFLLEGGSRLGICDYRPERGGWFGRFTVVD